MHHVNQYITINLSDAGWVSTATIDTGRQSPVIAKTGINTINHSKPQTKLKHLEPIAYSNRMMMLGLGKPGPALQSTLPDIPNIVGYQLLFLTIL